VPAIGYYDEGQSMRSLADQVEGLRARLCREDDLKQADGFAPLGDWGEHSRHAITLDHCDLLLAHYLLDIGMVEREYPRGFLAVAPGSAGGLLAVGEPNQRPPDRSAIDVLGIKQGSHPSGNGCHSIHRRSGFRRRERVE
jgi:hypothetical protein